jgi:hypothetical protein
MSESRSGEHQELREQFRIAAEKARNTERRAKATKAADTWGEGIIASIPVAVDESMQL